MLGHPEGYSVCFDYDDSGVIDSGDLSRFSASIGQRCDRVNGFEERGHGMKRNAAICAARRTGGAVRILATLVVVLAWADGARAGWCSLPLRSPWSSGPEAGNAATIILCGDVSVTFSRSFTGTYRHGQPYDVLTTHPDGTGETLEDTGITLRVHFYCGFPGCEPTGAPPPEGIPAEEIVLFNSQLCFCQPMHAARPTDANGDTEFTGTFQVGGCADQLALFADGVFIANIPIKINSPDAPGATPCAVDASDISALASRLGRPDQYSICFDYNESGVIDAGDVSFFAAALRRRCP